MKREIKFRAWDLDFKKMLMVHEATFVNGTMIGVKGVNWDSKVIVMQSTGLHDKNGKEIYEGDVLESTETGRIYRILYLESWTRFAQYELVETIGQRDEDGSILRSNGISEDFSDDCLSNPEFYEVIGNIYKNPELLKGESL